MTCYRYIYNGASDQSDTINYDFSSPLYPDETHWWLYNTELMHWLMHIFKFVIIAMIWAEKIKNCWKKTAIENNHLLANFQI